MSVYDQVMETFRSFNEIIIKEILEYEEQVEKETAWLDNVQKDIDEFTKTGILPQSIFTTEHEAEAPSLIVQPTNDNADLGNDTDTHSSNSLKENEPINAESSTGKRITRRTKNLILSNVKKIHDNFENKLNNVQIKLEKTIESICGPPPVSIITVKQEMPPPKKPAVRNTRKKRAGEADRKIKSELIDQFKQESHVARDSDVQIQKQSVDVIELEDTIMEQEVEPVKKTRARTKAAKKNLESSVESHSESEHIKTRGARTKRNKEKDKENEQSVDQNTVNLMESTVNDQTQPRKTRSRNTPGDQEQSNSDDNEPQTKKRKVEEEVGYSIIHTSTPIVQEQPKNNLNATMVVNKPGVLNETVVIETVSKDDAVNCIMTDDEDIIKDSPPPAKPKTKTKVVFSPYENSPVKKRVQAFEKLGAAAGSASKIPSKLGNKPSSDKDLTKARSSAQKTTEIPRLLGTPLMENRLRHLQTASASKLQTNAPTLSYNAPLSAIKSTSVYKKSSIQTEYRERELRRQQKDAEALQKKEALLLAQTEEKRKKREERELKAQQIKNAMERDKQKQLETAEKAKNEKANKILAEKEAKLLKQKEEVAKKRAAASKRAAEAKQKEDKTKFVPPYLKYETPLLPSPDCYDSDDDSKTVIKVPNWQKRPLIAQAQHAMRFIDPFKKTFFLSGPRTPDLQSIFPTIAPSKLLRTSSAIWNKTEMTMMDNLTEDDED